MQIKQIKVGFHANWQWVLCKWVDTVTTPLYANARQGEKKYNSESVI